MSQQFEDFTPNPDAGLWQSIDSALDRKERRSKFIWYWLAAGVLLSVVGAGLLQWNSSHKGNRTASVAQVQNKNHSASGTNTEARPTETPALDDALVSNQKSAVKPAETAKTERVIGSQPTVNHTMWTRSRPAQMRWNRYQNVKTIIPSMYSRWT